MYKIFLSSLIVVFGFVSSEAKFDVHDFFSDNIFYDSVSKKQISIYDEVEKEWVKKKSKSKYKDTAWTRHWNHVFYAKYAFKALKKSNKWLKKIKKAKHSDFKSTGTNRSNGRALTKYVKADQLALMKKLKYYFDFEKKRATTHAFFKDPLMQAVTDWVDLGMTGQYSSFSLPKADVQSLNGNSALISAFGREQKAKPMHNKYYFLSNYYEAGVDYTQTQANTGAQWTPCAKNKTILRLKGKRIFANNVEALYQATKAEHLKMANWEKIAAMDANSARNALSGKWPKVPVPNSFMTPLLDDKFNSSNLLARQLIYTGNKLLIEGNDWHDTHWGMVRDNGGYRGENKLGMYLMKLRRDMALKLLGNNPDWNYAGWLFAVPELRFVPVS